MAMRMGDIFMKPALTALAKHSRRGIPHAAAAVLLGLCGVGTQASPVTNGIGNPMLHIPQLPRLHAQRTYNPQLTKLWHLALQQNIPEVITKTCVAIRPAVKNKVPDLHILLPSLEHLAVSKTLPLTVKTSVVRALVEIADQHTQSLLVHLDSAQPSAFAQILDPLLAKWHTVSMRSVWMARLKNPADALQVKVSAATALGAAGDHQADAVLKKVVQNAGEPLILRFAAARSLAKLRAGGVVALCKRMLKAQGHSVPQRLLSCCVLSGGKTPAQRKMLLALAGDSNSAVAAIAWRALIKTDVNALRPLASHMSGNADPTIRLLVAKAWRRIGGNKSIDGLGATLNDQRRPVRWYARDALIFLGSHTPSRMAVIHTCRLIIHGSNPMAIRQACLVLGKLDDKASAGDFVSLLSNKSQAVRLGAMVALRRVAVRGTMPAVFKFAQRTAKNSQYVSANLKKPGYAARLNDDNLQLSQAFQFLGLMHYAPALSVMIPCIPKHAPYGVEARQAAIWAIGMIDNGQNHPKLAKQLAGRLDDMEMPMPEFEQVREMSALTLGRIHAKARLTDLNASYSAMDIGPLSLACRWAIGKITGKVPPLPHATSVFQAGFLVPLSQH